MGERMGRFCVPWSVGVKTERGAPAASARVAAAWITGPSARGSENGTPTSTRSAPAGSDKCGTTCNSTTLSAAGTLPTQQRRHRPGSRAGSS